MTWRDFVNSKYNIETIYKRFEIVENMNGVKLENSLEFIFKNGNVKPSDLIINECVYYMSSNDPT